MKVHRSVAHLTGKEQNALHNIKNRVVEKLKPQLIFCYRTETKQSIQRNCFTNPRKAEDWQFSCNLLIVISEKTTIEDHVLKETIQLTEPFGNVNVKVHPLDFVLNQLEENTLFFVWVHRTAIVLYERDKVLEQFPSPIPKREEYQKQVEEFYQQNPGMTNYLEEKMVLVAEKEENTIKVEKALPKEYHPQYLSEKK